MSFFRVFVSFFYLCEFLGTYLNVDFRTQRKFTESIAVMMLRPVVVLILEATKQVVLQEKTILWEEGMEDAFKRKKAKIEKLTGKCNHIKVSHG